MLLKYLIINELKYLYTCRQVYNDFFFGFF